MHHFLVAADEPEDFKLIRAPSKAPGPPQSGMHRQDAGGGYAREYLEHYGDRMLRVPDAADVASIAWQAAGTSLRGAGQREWTVGWHVERRHAAGKAGLRDFVELATRAHDAPWKSTRASCPRRRTRTLHLASRVDPAHHPEWMWGAGSTSATGDRRLPVMLQYVCERSGSGKTNRDDDQEGGCGR